MKKEEILEKDRKGYDFGNGNNEAAVSSRRYGIDFPIPDNLFVLHHCSFEVKLDLNEKIRGYSSFPDFFQSLLMEECRLSGHYYSHSPNTCDLVLSGNGLYPGIIRQLLHQKCVVKSIAASHIEVKAFPYPHTTSLFIEAFKSLPQLNIPINRLHKFNYDFWIQLDDYKFACYQLNDGTSYGKALEMWYMGKVEEDDFKHKVEAMISKFLEYYSIDEFRGLDDIVSPTGHRPAGIALETIKRRNKLLARQARLEIETKAIANGIVTQEDFEKAYSYLSNRNSVNKMKFRLLKEFNLDRYMGGNPSVVSWATPEFFQKQKERQLLLPIDFSLVESGEVEI